jgi:dihydrofolate reductase
MVIFSISMSLDGFITGPNSRPDAPLGDGGELLHRWGEEDEEGRKLVMAAIDAAGAAIVSRRTYDQSIQWWGAAGPAGPARLPVIVVTHQAPTDAPEGGVYTFITEGIEAALQAAQAAAGGKHVAIGGGAGLAQQYLRAGLIDELSIHLVPVLFGSGIRLFDNLGDTPIRLEPLEAIQTAGATHLRWRVAPFQEG